MDISQADGRNAKKTRTKIISDDYPSVAAAAVEALNETAKTEGYSSISEAIRKPANVIEVHAGSRYKTVQAAVDAAKAAYDTDGLQKTVIDYTNGSATKAAGVTVVDQFGRSDKPVPCTNVVKIHISDSHKFGSASVGSSISSQAQFYCPHEVKDIQPAYYNYQVTKFDTDPLKTTEVTIKACLIYNSRIYPIYFGGKRSVTISPEGVVVADPVPLTIAAGTCAVIRTQASVQNANDYVYGPQIRATGSAKIPIDIYNSTADFSSTKNNMTQESGVNYALTPLTILGKFTKVVNPKIYAGIGDSITSVHIDNLFSCVYAQITSGNIDTLQCGIGLAGRTLDHIHGVCQLTKIIENCNHVICSMGANDMASYAQTWITKDALKSGFINAWKALQKPWNKVYQTLITPNTSTADGTTAALQTHKPCNAACVDDKGQPFEDMTAIIAWLNDWLTETALLYGVTVIDWASPVSAVHNSKIVWKDNYSNDGIHPSKIDAITAMGAAIKAVVG